jgi:hypothetical protein
MTSDAAADHRQLVLISGPIASGKTTAAFRLAALTREHGQRAAAIDIDELVEMVAGEDWSLVRLDDRKLAIEAAAAIADRLFDAGVALVAVAGSTLSSYEWTCLLESLACRPTTLTVLRVSLAESIRRAQSDTLRIHTVEGDSERRNFIVRLYGQISGARLTTHDIEIETDGRSVDEVVSLISENLRAGVS